MNPNERDDRWRNALDRHPSPLDTDRFWQSLEPRLPQRRRKKRWPVWWSFLLAGILLVAGWMLTSRDIVPDSATASMKEIPSPVKATGQGAVEAGVPDYGSAADLEPADSDTGSGMTISRIGKRDPSSRPAGGGLDPGYGGTLRTSPLPGKPDSSSKRVRESGTTEPERTPAIGPSVSPMVLEERPGEAPTPHNLLLPAPEEESTASMGYKQEWMTGLPTLLNGVEGTNPVTGAGQPLLLQRVFHSWQWFVDVVGGVGFPSRDFKAATQEGAAIVADRRSSETTLLSWSAGADVRCYSPSGIFLQSGIRYHEIRERYDWQGTETRYSWEYAEGDLWSGGEITESWADSTWVARQLTRTVRHYNRVATWDVPVLLGYRHVWGTWSGDVALGAQINLSQQVDGRSSGMDGRPSYWNEDAALMYRPRLGWGAVLQGRLAWYPRLGYGVFIQPVWQWLPDSRTDPKLTGYETRYHMFYLQSGISIRLR